MAEKEGLKVEVRTVMFEVVKLLKTISRKISVPEC